MKSPKLAFWLGTWTGRLILVNALVFVALTIAADGSLFMPDTPTLIAAGAKDPVSLAQGQWWRFITPMFLHIGIIHFAVNNYMLYAIGQQLERLLGSFWYIVVYLAAGVAGNVASSVFSVSLSAGASGAIFGLLGAGLLVERLVGRKLHETTGQKQRYGAYASTVAINLAFGFIVPFIDNSAHLGGLVAGVALTGAMVNLRPNRLQQLRRWIGVTLIAVLFGVSAVGIWFGMSPRHVRDRFVAAADKADDGEEKIFMLTDALKIDPDDAQLWLARAKLQFGSNEPQYALYDVREALRDPSTRDEVTRLADELEAAGKASDAWNIRRLLAHGAP